MIEHERGNELRIEAPGAPGHINPELYINRELSWIEFNRRVLDEARDQRNPLLERVKFAAIFSTNLDEFFMIRVSGIKEQIQAGVTTRSLNGSTPQEQLQAIRIALEPLIAERQRLLADDLLPALRAEGIQLLYYEELNSRQQEWLRAYFIREIFPVLTPLAIDPSHPFPFISNLSLNLAVVIDDDEVGAHYARLKVPEVLPRLIELPAELSDGGSGATRPVAFAWLEGVIKANIALLFPGKTVRETYGFRVTRDADLEIKEDEADDLLETMEQSVRQRRFGLVVRLSLDARASPIVRTLLVHNLSIQENDVYAMDGPLGFSALFAIANLDRPALKDPPFVPGVPTALRADGTIFDAIRQQDILLHHPFDAFTPVIDLIKAAARDPHVLAIKMTLYRVGRNSPIVRALMSAREQGKQVAVLVELKARFDEENNIGWARALEHSGVHVTYGLIGLKTHAKLLLIVRKDQDGIRRYMHLGTGNYNAVTAKLYTDFSFMTCDDAIGADVSELFNVLTGFSEQTVYRKLLVAPHSLHTAILERIEREIARHAETGGGHLIFKCNGLTDEAMIIALYRAAQAGVQVDLIVRGICSVRPGIRGLSTNIRVRSIVGRFLEHHRVYYFRNGGDEELLLGSADLMERNLHKRVETVFPVENAHLRHYLRATVLDLYLRDNTHAHELQPDGSYVRLQPGDAEVVDSQQQFLAIAASRSGVAAIA